MNFGGSSIIENETDRWDALSARYCLAIRQLAHRWINEEGISENESTIRRELVGVHEEDEIELSLLLELSSPLDNCFSVQRKSQFSFPESL